MSRMILTPTTRDPKQASRPQASLSLVLPQPQSGPSTTCTQSRRSDFPREISVRRRDGTCASLIKPLHVFALGGFKSRDVRTLRLLSFALSERRLNYGHHDRILPRVLKTPNMSPAGEHSERSPLLQSNRLSQLQHEHDEEAHSIIASTVTKEEQHLAGSTVGERLPYNDYTTIDWLHDLVTNTSPSP
jgi:hypothetical protein